MDEVIKKIQELFETLKSAISAVAAERSSIADSKKAVEKRNEELTQLETSLNAREVETKKIEDVVALKESAVVMKKNVGIEIEKLEAQKVAHTKKVQDDAERINKAKRDVEEQKANQVVEAKNLKAGNEKLEKDRQNYKDEVLTEMLKKK